jgi:HAD superfamily hydrolase (TIGR01662 family)
MAIADVDDIHGRMQTALAASAAQCDAVLVCPHDEGSCGCRKPGLGLFVQAQALIPEIDLDRAAVVGDSATDLIAANRLGCPSFLVGDEHALVKILVGHPDLSVAGRAPSLLSVVTDCLGLREPT